MRTDSEEQALQVAGLLLGELEQAGGLVQGRASRLLVLLERVSRDQEQRRAGVDDACGAAEQRRALAVGHVLVDAPVVARRRGGGDRDEGHVTGGPTETSSASECTWLKACDVLGAVDTAEGKLAVDGALLCRRLEEYTERIGGDRALREQIVDDGRDLVRAGDGALGEIGGADTENTVNAVEALGLRGNADRLILDDEGRGERNSVGI